MGQTNKNKTNKLPSFIDKFSNFMPYSNTHQNIQIFMTTSMKLTNES
jgi:hypothetical protein